MTYDNYNPQSIKILFRTVYNDAVVGEWRELAEYMTVQNHTLEGLKEWMLDDNNKFGVTDEDGRYSGWDLTKLEVGGFNNHGVQHLFNYGLRLQFWIPVILQKPTEEEIADFEDEFF